MERKEENNMFKYATKELSQDAFICWCINWINYPNSELYQLGKDMLREVLFPNVNNEKLYPFYSKVEIIEKYNLFRNDNENEKISEEYKEFEKIYKQKNDEISIIKKNIEKSICELKNKIDLDKITNLKIVRQFHRMDIVVTINKEYVVIIEDKIDGTTEGQLERYSEVMQNIINENNEEDLELLELDINKFNIKNIIPVYMKTGNETLEEKLIAFRRINGNVILEVLNKYRDDNRVEDFYTCLSDKLNKEDTYKYQKLIQQGYIEIGEKFQKRYVIYNCFEKYIKNTYSSNKSLIQTGYYRLLNSNVVIWTPRLFKYNGWKNRLENNGQTIIEERIDYIEDSKLNSKEIRYVFARKRDLFNSEYFEFCGIYSLDLSISTDNKRTWKRLEIEKVPLNIEEVKIIE